MTKANPFLWPKKSKLSFYNGRGKCINRSSDRRFDLSDNLMLSWPYKSRTVYFGMLTNDPDWHTWEEDRLSQIEELVRYDLRFDGYYVTVKRITTNTDAVCTEEFRWKLIIREVR